MLSLPLPNIDHRTLYDQCALQTQNAEDRAVVVALGDRIEAAGVAFADAAAVQQLFGLQQIALTQHEDGLIRSMYSKRLANKAGSGRWAYDSIRNSALFCPYCTFGEVNQVDHFLAKQDFREINICPANLLPICQPCNHIKDTIRPDAADRYLLHPYFDQLPRIPWLFAELSYESGGPVLTYRVELDVIAFGNLAGRLRYHFQILELDRRFQERATRVLVAIESDMASNFDLLGPQGMREHFNSESTRHFQRHGNSLESAAYLAAAENPEYCGGKFKN